MIFTDDGRETSYHILLFHTLKEKEEVFCENISHSKTASGVYGGRDPCTGNFLGGELTAVGGGVGSDTAAADLLRGPR